MGRPPTSSGCCCCCCCCSSCWWKTGWGNAGGYMEVAGRDCEMRSLRADDDEWEVGRLRTLKVSREDEAGREGREKMVSYEQLQNASEGELY